MRKVEREEILDFTSYDDAARAGMRAAVMEVKRRRRIPVGPYLTFLFENTATIRYQIQEMIRVARIERETDVLREIATFNAVLGNAGQLGCCLLIEIDDPLERTSRFRDWRELPAHVYLRCAGGPTVRPYVDEARIGGSRTMAVQYLKFGIDDWVPIAIGCDLPGLTAETLLDDEQREALVEDLAIAPC